MHCPEEQVKCVGLFVHPLPLAVLVPLVEPLGWCVQQQADNLDRSFLLVVLERVLW